MAGATRWSTHNSPGRAPKMHVHVGVHPQPAGRPPTRPPNAHSTPAQAQPCNLITTACISHPTPLIRTCSPQTNHGIGSAASPGRPAWCPEAAQTCSGIAGCRQQGLGRRASYSPQQAHRDSQPDVQPCTGAAGSGVAAAGAPAAGRQPGARVPHRYISRSTGCSAWPSCASASTSCASVAPGRSVSRMSAGGGGGWPALACAGGSCGGSARAAGAAAATWGAEGGTPGAADASQSRMPAHARAARNRWSGL